MWKLFQMLLNVDLLIYLAHMLSKLSIYTPLWKLIKILLMKHLLSFPAKKYLQLTGTAPMADHSYRSSKSRNSNLNYYKLKSC